MALTINEASAVNTLLDFLADDGRVRALTDVPFYSPTPHHRAHVAAQVLAEHAHKQLRTGWTASDVERYLPVLPKAVSPNPKEAA